MIDHSRRLVLTPETVVRALDNEALVLNLRNEEVFALNATAVRIVQLVQEGHPLAAIVDILTTEYATARQQIVRELDLLIEALMAKGLVAFEAGHSQR